MTTTPQKNGKFRKKCDKYITDTGQIVIAKYKNRYKQKIRRKHDYKPVHAAPENRLDEYDIPTIKRSCGIGKSLKRMQSE